MLISNITGVNFINDFRAHFSYESYVLEAFSCYMYVKKWRSYEKLVRLTLMKLTAGKQQVKEDFKKNFQSM